MSNVSVRCHTGACRVCLTGQWLQRRLSRRLLIRACHWKHLLALTIRPAACVGCQAVGGLVTTEADPTTEAHPAWFARHFCTANRRHARAHRSRPIVVSEKPLCITTKLYAFAVAPEEILIEVHKNRVPLVLLPVGVAHGLGRV